MRSTTSYWRTIRRQHCECLGVSTGAVVGYGLEAVTGGSHAEKRRSARFPRSAHTDTQQVLYWIKHHGLAASSDARVDRRTSDLRSHLVPPVRLICRFSTSSNLLRYMTTFSNQQAFAELYYAQKLIKDVLGVTPLCWRPPYGDVDNRVRLIAQGLNMTTIVWSDDSVRFCSLGTFTVSTVLWVFAYDLTGGLERRCPRGQRHRRRRLGQLSSRNFKGRERHVRHPWSDCLDARA